MGTAAPPRPADTLIRESFDLAILESTESGGSGVFNPDGTVDMVLIRPCNGRGLGARIFEAEVLRDNAHIFKGWPMFDNHDSPAAKRARQGLPRPVTELAGVVRESHWDPDFVTPQDEAMGFDQGAVIGRCALTDIMEALVRKVPETIRGSLNCQATNLRRGERRGKPGWIVEGLVDDPENSSFDLVTKAGAGGQVRPVLESLADTPVDHDLSVLESVDDAHLTAWLTEHRPTILESPGGAMGMTVQEALQTDEVKGYITNQVQETVAGLLPEMRDTIRDEVREELGETARLRSLAGTAAKLISESALPQSAKLGLLTDYGIQESQDDSDDVTPGRLLAGVASEVDDAGKVVKTARTVLEAAVDADIKRTRELLRTAAPTVPLAPGAAPGAILEAAGDTDAGAAFRQQMTSAGLDPALFGMAPIESE